MFMEFSEVNSNIKSSAKLWRYMDFTKLVNLISTQSLYFCRSDKFKDVFEGKVFGLDKKYDFLNNTDYPGEDVKDAILKDAWGYDKAVMEYSELQRKNTFVNCWHLNEYESAAMWDLYLKSNEGIAVQTTFEKLKKSLEVCEEGIFVGKVNYIDHTTDCNYHGSTISPFFTKRLSFKHEEEVRLVYSPLANNEDITSGSKEVFGRNIKIDISELIERVYVSPDAAPWFVEVVRVVLKKFDVNAEVVYSDLYEIK